jgi:hypothetical protein
MALDRYDRVTARLTKKVALKYRPRESWFLGMTPEAL